MGRGDNKLDVVGEERMSRQRRPRDGRWGCSVVVFCSLSTAGDRGGSKQAKLDGEEESCSERRLVRTAHLLGFRHVGRDSTLAVLLRRRASAEQRGASARHSGDLRQGYGVYPAFWAAARWQKHARGCGCERIERGGDFHCASREPAGRQCLDGGAFLEYVVERLS